MGWVTLKSFQPKPLWASGFALGPPRVSTYCWFIPKKLQVLHSGVLQEGSQEIPKPGSGIQAGNSLTVAFLVGFCSHTGQENTHHGTEAENQWELGIAGRGAGGERGFSPSEFLTPLHSMVDMKQNESLSCAPPKHLRKSTHPIPQYSHTSAFLLHLFIPSHHGFYLFSTFLIHFFSFVSFAFLAININSIFNGYTLSLSSPILRLFYCPACGITLRPSFGSSDTPLVFIPVTFLINNCLTLPKKVHKAGP